MANKFYLREDRKAVKPEMEEPKQAYNGVPNDYYHFELQKFNEHVNSLPALDVDPDYLETLRPGWFEGEERYEVYEYGRRWIVVDKDKYDSYGEQYRRLTIVAPQEAERGLSVTGVVQDVDRTALEFDKIRKDMGDVYYAKNEAEKGQEGDRYAKLKQKMREFFDSVTPEELIEKFEKMGYTFVPIPATPQPVTGEWQLCPLCNGQGSVTKPAHIPGDVTQWLDSEGIHTCHICNGDKLIAKPQAASRPSDAVEFVEWLYRECSHHSRDGINHRFDGKDYTTGQIYKIFNPTS